MSQLVDDLLSNLDIVDAVGRYVDLKKTGANFSGLCPFHNEKTPSFVVSPQKQIFKCFGCGKGGDAITFIKEIERIDFRDAAKLLAKDAHIDLEKYTDDKKGGKKNSPQYTEEKEMLKYIHKVAQEFFDQQLKNSDEAMGYLADQRKIDQQSIKTFGICYAPSSYYDLINHLRDKGFSNDDILKSSLGKQRDGEVFSFFRYRIMFPIRDTMGNVVAFSGRVVDNQDKPKYLNSSEHTAFEKSKILYGLDVAKQYIKTHDKLIVVEGQMDVVGLYRLGLPVGIATSGTALTQYHINTIKRYTSNVYFLFDNDQAGRQATIRALKLAYQQGLFPKVITLPSEYKDIDELANITEGETIFDKCLYDAKDAFATVIQRYLEQYDMTSPIDKQKFLHEVFAILLTISDIAIQDHYLNLIADYIHTRYEILATQYKKYRATDGRLYLRQNHKPQQEKYSLNRELLLGALFVQDFLLQYLPHEDPQSTSFIQLIDEVSKYKDSVLYRVKYGESSPEELKEYQQMHLWWENIFSELPSDVDRYQYVRKFSMPLLQKYIKNILSDKTIPPQQKQNILTLKKKI